MKIMHSGFSLTGFAFAFALAAGCHGAPRPEPGAQRAPLQLTSIDFPPGGSIPAALTCDGVNRSPSLTWSDPPAGTKSFVLILDDPDAPVGTFVHWVLYNLPPTARSLPPAVPKQNEVAGGGRQGRNDFGDIGYGGPCPPGHMPHHYRFLLYALDTPLSLHAGATKPQVEDALKGHILARGRMVGVYSR